MTKGFLHLGMYPCELVRVLVSDDLSLGGFLVLIGLINKTRIKMLPNKGF